MTNALATLSPCHFATEMRAFIAVELPAEIRNGLARLQSQLAQARADLKWTEEANLHITMRFLGEITDEQRQAVEAVLQGVAAQVNAIPVQLTGVGAFPSMASPRVLWVGVGEGQQTLHTIAEAIERGVVSLGLPKDDHPFTAHVTLGRVRSPKNRTQLVATVQHVTWTPPAPFVATHLTLFHSTLTSSGASYTLLAKCPFA